MRIRMPAGHTELCLAGVKHTPDVEGTFDIPPEHFENLQAHGAVFAPSVQDLDAKVDALEAHVGTLKAQIDAVTKELDSARKIADAARVKQRASIKSVVADLTDKLDNAGNDGDGTGDGEGKGGTGRRVPLT